jgi:hypothetical protein
MGGGVKQKDLTAQIKRQVKTVTETVQTGLRLPKRTYEQLSKSERGISEEIRRRLDQTLYLDQFDVQTRELADDIMRLAVQVRLDTDVAWYENPRAFETFSVAVAEWLKSLEPPQHGAASDSFGPDDPQTLGRAIARHHAQFKSGLGQALSVFRRDVTKKRE